MSATTSRVGELRPNQLLYTFGVGAAVDLPHLSAIVLGLDDWDPSHSEAVDELRLLGAVRSVLGKQVSALRLPPFVEATGNPLEEWARIGVPVAPFPRWLRCPRASCSHVRPVTSTTSRGCITCIAGSRATRPSSSSTSGASPAEPPR